MDILRQGRFFIAGDAHAPRVSPVYPDFGVGTEAAADTGRQLLTRNMQDKGTVFAEGGRRVPIIAVQKRRAAVDLFHVQRDRGLLGKQRRQVRMLSGRPSDVNGRKALARDLGAVRAQHRLGWQCHFDLRELPIPHRFR